MTFTVAIIGSAGRQNDALKVSKERFEWIINTIKAELLACNAITEKQDSWLNIELISGGAAFSDHAAVVLAQEKGCSLKLCLPSPWDSGKQQYVDTGIRDWRQNPGGTSNFYHCQFSKKVERDSLKELDAIIPTSTIIVEDGFHARNSVIAGPVDLLLAFTFSDNSDLSASSGTLSTWKKSAAKKKVHRSIP